MTFAAAEDWLVAVIKDVVGPNVAVITGPHDWDGSFVKNLLTSLPAVVITLDGGTVADGTSVTLDATWTLYVVAGWGGGDQASRRRAATKGAYAIATALIVRLHNTNMGERQYSARGTGSAVPNIPDLDDLDGFGQIRIGDFTNEGSGEWERVGIALYSIELEQNVPLELPVDANLADWLRTNATFDIPGGEEFDPDTDEIGVDGDLTSRFDMP